MKLKLSESGHSIDWKPLVSVAVSFGITEDGPFGKDYHFLAFEKDSNISGLLNKNEKDFKVYLFKNILYMNLDSDENIYIVKMHKENLSDCLNQIKKDNKVVIGILNNDILEKVFVCDVIL